MNTFKRYINKILILVLTCSILIAYSTEIQASTGSGTLSDTNIKYFGRWDYSDGQVFRNYWGGAYFKVNFTGTTVQIQLASEVDLYINIDGNASYIDDANGTVNLTPEPLSSGEHTLMVASRYHDDLFEFKGLILDANATTIASDVSSTIIEFAGDSITAGYKLSQQAISDYAWLTAEQLGYEHTQIAFSGINLEDDWSASYVESKIGLSKQFFKLENAYYQDARDWDFNLYQPKMVVVNIGTNDHFMNVPESTFESTYITFLENIRRQYGKAEILVLRPFGGYMEDSTLKAVNARLSSGDLKVHYIDTTGWLDSSDFPADDYVHPTDNAHIKIANQLAPVIESFLLKEPGEEESNILSTNTKVLSNGQVLISGRLATGVGQMVTVKVLNPNDGIEYLDQTLTNEGGSFEFAYQNPAMNNGAIYTVEISAYGESKPITTTFQFQRGSSSIGDDDDDENEKKDKQKISSGQSEMTLPHPTFDASKGVAKVDVSTEIIKDAFDAAEADKYGIKKIKLEIPKVSEAETYLVELPGDELISGTSFEVLQLKTNIGTVTVPTNMMEGIIKHADSITIAIDQSGKDNISPQVMSKIGDRPIVNIDVEVDGNKVSWQNEKAPIEIAIPYIPTETELINPEHILIYYITEDGNEVPIRSGKYDDASGTVTFKTNHLSKFAVAYVMKTFNDVSDYPWVKREIEVLASRGIINGTSEVTFAPSENIKRADFICLLVSALELDADVNDNFSDVKQSDYYYRAVGIAKKLGITSGIGDNKFNPEASIMRQDMMVLTSRALKVAGITLDNDSDNDSNKFKDQKDISPYALEHILPLVNEGIVMGDGEHLDPLKALTRAETASIIYKVYRMLND
ncbi:S-layer homology domain-containing protein [Vallitalea okinawensis]|uniref:S-layer homology domain-containing protein n=1 Tax=Vallitalea okinawensis TaxID=2078660 RepID=UPI000CFB5164|nr:S-layer homology domain-containing protein [Vallitalea okinawensis]